MNIKDNGVYIVDGIRTGIGNYGGSLSSMRADNLISQPINFLVNKYSTISRDIDEVVIGCANQSGEDNRNIARMSILLSDLEETVPGITLNRLCASGLDSVIYGYTKIRSGLADVILAGGVENMSRSPFVMSKSEFSFDRNVKIYDTTLGWRFINKKIEDKYGCDSLGMTAENISDKYNITRERQDLFAYNSQYKASIAIKRERFKKEILPISIRQKKGPDFIFDKDEFPRDSSIEKLSKLKAVFKAGGTVTAGNSSGINDGASVILLVSGSYAKKMGLIPLAEICESYSCGVVPSLMGIGPVYSTLGLLKKINITMKDIDLIEINEAFSSQSLACLESLNIRDDDSRVNPNGGAIALGHPLGMSGNRLVLTSALELKESNLRSALVTMCIGVGQGVSLIIRSVN